MLYGIKPHDTSCEKISVENLVVVSMHVFNSHIMTNTHPHSHSQVVSISASVWDTFEGGATSLVQRTDAPPHRSAEHISVWWHQWRFGGFARQFPRWLTIEQHGDCGGSLPHHVHLITVEISLLHSSRCPLFTVCPPYCILPSMHVCQFMSFVYNFIIWISVFTILITEDCRNLATLYWLTVLPSLHGTLPGLAKC